jgi:hypothetical protein
MKNWTLVVLGTLAGASMMIASTACSATSSGADGSAGYGGSDAAGAGGTSAAGAGGSAAAGAGGGTAGAGGGGANVIAAFGDGACKTCLLAKVTTGKVPADPTKGIPSEIDCSKVVDNCGANNETCKPATDCVATAQPKNPTNLDCAVESCALNISSEPKANEFFSCLALNCATECGATLGFSNTGPGKCN